MSPDGGTGAIAGAMRQQGMAMQLIAKTLAKVGPAGNMPARAPSPLVAGKGLRVNIWV